MTRRSRRAARTRLLVPVLAGLLTLAACNQAQDGQSNNIEASANQSGSGDAAHSIPMSGEYPVLPDGKLGRPVDWVEPHEPQLPSAATNMDAFGARYFAEYYLNLLAYSINTGNTTTLKKVSSPECKVCQSFINEIETQYTGGGWNIGMKYEVRTLDDGIPHSDDEDVYLVVGTVHTPIYVAFNEEGKIVSGVERTELIELEVDSGSGSFVLRRLYGDSKDEGSQS